MILRYERTPDRMSGFARNTQYVVCYAYAPVDSINLRITRVPTETLAAFMEAVAAHPSADLNEIADFAGFGARTAVRAVPSLETIGVVERNPSGVYRIKAEGVRRGMSSDEAQIVLRRALQGFRPFEMLVEGLALGEDSATAARKAALLLGIDNGMVERLDVLLGWGADLGILERAGSGFKLVAELRTTAVEEVGGISSDDVESEAKARLYNAKRLGRSAHNYLDEVDRELLAQALLEHEGSPRKSVEDSGQAFEDFLREVAVKHGLSAEAKKANGAGQLANLLYSKGVIHTHHQKLADAISTPRNATAHRKDKKTMTPWEITALGAFSTHSMTLAVIRSIHEYTVNRKQTL